MIDTQTVNVESAGLGRSSRRDRTITQVVPVTFTYPVHFTEHLFDPQQTLLRDILTGPEASGGQPPRVLCVVDDGVLAAFPGLEGQIQAYFAAQLDLTLVAPPLTVPGGERCKSDPDVVGRIHEAINAHGIDRHAYVIAVGGGAVLDMVGYAAATAHRGVRLVRVPTTVLSQNDSAVGVKNSVNAFGKKNWLGTFAPPHAVLNDRSFLTTLEDRDWLGGLSEALKVALLKDAAFFEWLEANAVALAARDQEAMDHAVYRCAELHLEHIARSGDPFERGSSRPLDFGHWAAHKLESLSNYELRHGEAVAVGIALDCTYAALSGLLPEADWRRILDVLRTLKLAVSVPELGSGTQDATNPTSVLSGLNEFREHLGGRLTIPLLTGIGQPVEVHEMDHDILRRAIALLEDVQAQASSLPLSSPHTQGVL
ncbi:3-dehydroquinate synthase [Deinococcus radiopugnans]|uniref:3-dehydroquinate synthase n=1 Tax=Deinococcus radiopugnans ATCC 19172 TaxID=585398 RepID=A0A5C4Y658_9DEIO|nr:3-dehydroquinate synthase [Deinococcus radiopugnans]MBB6016394.1 3-dehydroquinate synthase [Deinococcus radiopugnans ATCC 19172]TNM71355.1 3-dehydroquinate synthase [Deinococcus radiopugnans ATCC 19172]